MSKRGDVVITHTLTAGGGARPSLKDLGVALDLLKAHGAPEDRMVKVSMAVGGPWAVTVEWSPDPVDPVFKDPEFPTARELLDAPLDPLAYAHPVNRTRTLRDNPQA